MFDSNNAPSLKSSSISDRLFQLEEKIKNLPPEYIHVIGKAIIVDVKVVNNKLSEQIYDSKKTELIGKLETQINFTVSKKLKDQKYATIKKDILFYKKAYENEAANVNKIIIATNKLNHELYKPLMDIKKALKEHYTEFQKNIENVNIPHDGMNKGVDSIKNNEIDESKKQEFEIGKNELNKSMDSYKEKAKEFLVDYNKMNEELSSSITDFLNSFDLLKNSVNELKKEIIDAFKIFENISPELEDLDDQEKIRKLTEHLLFPLNKITELIERSQGLLNENEKYLIQKEKDKESTNLANVMISLCSELKNKANNISGRINELRMKVNLQNIKIPHIELKEPDVAKINDNLGKMMAELNKAKEDNKNIQEEVKKRTKDFINQTRLDILFIIDCTNSVNTYLEDIKYNFTEMINKIQSECQMATIYIGFVGYLDFVDLELGEEYINIELTTKLNLITEKIKNLKPSGGGDTAEDIAGAFEMALNKNWQGISRFAILAADAPCHGNEFHGKGNVKNYDNHPEGDPNKRDIKKYVRDFAEKKISLFCAKFSDETDIMFDIFSKEYDKGKKKEDKCQFICQSCENLCDIIIQKAAHVYQINRKEEIENNDNNNDK